MYIVIEVYKYRELDQFRIEKSNNPSYLEMILRRSFQSLPLKFSV